MALIEAEIVRIPELPDQASLSDGDKIPVWVEADNRTRHTSLAALRTFLETGGSGTYDPIYSGGTILYVVPADEEGGDTISIPQIAGMNFKLKRDGFPLIPTTEFLVLDTGGAKLVDNTLIEGQRYEFDVFELATGSIPTPGGGGGGFIVGEEEINTNAVISANDVNKIFQVRGGSSSLTITLPDVEQCPDNSFIIIECLISNNKQHKVDTTNSQYIYHDNGSHLHRWLGKGERMWFYRKDDGWYVIDEKTNYGNKIAAPDAAYKVGLNQIELVGQLVNRADYPRLWEEVQSLGSALVSESTWQTASASVAGRTVEKPYRGCYSDGNGTTTFRLPDLRNMSLRGLKTLGGSDDQRHHNNPGGYQRHEFESHHHGLGHYRNDAQGGNQQNTFYLENDNGAIPISGENTQDSGGSENRMDNIGVIYVTNY